MNPDGICHICGLFRKLSFEHVPSQAAGNNKPILRFAFERFLAEPRTMDDLDRLRGKKEQRGIGAYTLCEKCNSDTGSWYGDAYADWAQQAMRYLMLTKGGTSLELPYSLYPLRVLKQVVCMFFSVNGPLMQTRQPDLVKFVLDRHSQAFPRHVRVYAFHTYGNRSRASGAAAVLHGLGTSRTQSHVFSEVTFPPFGFVMAFDGTPPPARGFCDISSFAQFRYRDWRTGITMRLPLASIYTPYPGDYRTQLQTHADYIENFRAETERRGND